MATLDFSSVRQNNPSMIEEYAPFQVDMMAENDWYDTSFLSDLPMSEADSSLSTGSTTPRTFSDSPVFSGQHFGDQMFDGMAVSYPMANYHTHMMSSSIPTHLYTPYQKIAEDKKPRARSAGVDKNSKLLARRNRQTRPKVVVEKGAVQCVGKNRKKGTQCRNAALMEYIGPRPIYCAEHIELDPNSLYEKCKAGYQKERGDNKNCKEVVLKEFGMCYKHYTDLVSDIVSSNNLEMAETHSKRIGELLEQLEKEAAAAKKKDGDLYQRKNKLIPKFQEMKKVIAGAVLHLTDPSSYPMPARNFNANVNVYQGTCSQNVPMQHAQTHVSDCLATSMSGPNSPLSSGSPMNSYSGVASPVSSSYSMNEDCMLDFLNIDAEPKLSANYTEDVFSFSPSFNDSTNSQEFAPLFNY